MPGPDRPFIAWLGRAGTGPEAIGGKGASLDRLTAMGFRVPPGFCITTDAFRHQRAATAGDLADLATAPLVPDVDAAISAAIGRLVAELEARAIEPSFAVRSSALGEDGRTASFAGLHETELGVAPADVPGAVRRCWASLWSAPAIAYRARRGLAEHDLAMAVVVQALVPADAAAVVFTRHPVTGSEDQLVLTAVRGLGDAMVSGTVTPDTYVVDRASRAIVTFDPGDDPADPALDAVALAELVDLSLAVESRFGAAVDIEAARAGGVWYLVQARPITTGAPVGSRA